MALSDILKIYTPEMVRWIFASYKPNTPFNLAFDLDVLRTYEDFDMMERWVYGVEGDNEEKRAAWRRVYEMSQLIDAAPLPAAMPFQPAFRHLCNNLQMNETDIARTRKMYDAEIKNEIDERRFSERAERAKYWLQNFAPDDFTFSVNSARVKFPMTEGETTFVKKLRDVLTAEWDNFADDAALQDRIGQLIEAGGLDSKAAYRVLYQLLVSRDRGPKLAAFMRAIGRERVLALL
jgi:lysyl-tRNA synthetase class 1